MEFDIVKEYCSIITSKLAIEDYQTALINTEKLLKYDTKNYLGFYYRGICNFALNNFNESEKDYTGAITYKPDFAKAYYNRGITRYYLGDFKNSLLDIEEAYSLFNSRNEKDSTTKCKETIDYIKEEISS